VPPPPAFWGGGAHSLAREGVGESQFRRGDIHCGTLYICTLCILPRFSVFLCSTFEELIIQLDMELNFKAMYVTRNIVHFTSCLQSDDCLRTEKEEC
jgi:hypothetical protein